jgi:hypothetical protein
VSKPLESKIRFVVRAFVWEGRFQRAKQIHQTVKDHKRTARDAVNAVKWWGRLILPAEHDD